MATKEFTLYVLSKDKDSENLVTYFYENMRDIKKRGFPKPFIFKVTKKELMKHKETLMNNGIRNIPSIKFNGNVYGKNEVYDLLRTDLNALKKKMKQKDEDLEEYYESTTRKYADTQDYFGNIMNRMGKKDSRLGYQSSEEKPLTDADIKAITSGRNQNNKKGETVSGNTYRSNSDSGSSSEDEKPKKKKSKSKKYDSSNIDAIDAYYASLDPNSIDLASD